MARDGVGNYGPSQGDHLMGFSYSNAFQSDNMDNLKFKQKAKLTSSVQCV